VFYDGLRLFICYFFDASVGICHSPLCCFDHIVSLLLFFLQFCYRLALFFQSLGLCSLIASYLAKAGRKLLDGGVDTSIVRVLLFLLSPNPSELV
jgi:hypothetical protein